MKSKSLIINDLYNNSNNSINILEIFREYLFIQLNSKGASKPKIKFNDQYKHNLNLFSLYIDTSTKYLYEENKILINEIVNILQNKRVYKIIYLLDYSLSIPINDFINFIKLSDEIFNAQFNKCIPPQEYKFKSYLSLLGNPNEYTNIHKSSKSLYYSSNTDFKIKNNSNIYEKVL